MILLVLAWLKLKPNLIEWDLSLIENKSQLDRNRGTQLIVEGVLIENRCLYNSHHVHPWKAISIHHHMVNATTLVVEPMSPTTSFACYHAKPPTNHSCPPTNQWGFFIFIFLPINLSTLETPVNAQEATLFNCVGTIGDPFGAIHYRRLTSSWVENYSK